VISVNPNVGYIVVQDLSDLIDDSGGELRADLSASQQSSDSLYLAFINHADALEFPSESLNHLDHSTTHWCIASFSDSDIKGAFSTEHFQQMNPGILEAVNRLIKVIVSVSFECQAEHGLSKNGQGDYCLEIVSNISIQVTVMLNWQSLVAVNHAWAENEARTCFVNVHIRAICHLF